MNFWRNHWFGLLVSVFMGLYVIVFLLVLMAPKQDAEQRGFVKCSAAMYENLQQCSSSKACMLKEVLRNSWCDVKVVAEGIKLWAQGAQATPWENYFFQPLSTKPQMTPEALEYYKQNQAEFAASMAKLKKLNAELEDKVAKHDEK